MSGGLRGTGQSPYSLAALSLRFSFVSSEPGEVSWLPLHLVMGWILLSEKNQWRNWGLQLAVSALHQLSGVISPLRLCLPLGSMEQGGDRVREAGKRDGTKDAAKRAENWCGTAEDIAEHTAVLACCFL